MIFSLGTNPLTRRTSNQDAFETRAIHAGQEPDPQTGAVVTPIYTSSTFVQGGIGDNRGFIYSRSGNPTRLILEACLADLEGAETAIACPSGLSAASTILELLESGAHVVAHHDVYGGIYRLLEMVRSKSAGLDITFVNFSDKEAVRAAIRPDTAMLWFETPSNPLLEIVDIVFVVEEAKRVGALSVCDNTFCSPYCQRPLEQGVDIVMHSATKFLNGHSDLIAGVVAVSTNCDPEIVKKIRFLQNATGAVMDPIACSTLLRSLKTLPIRMERHNQNAEKIAVYLDENVERLGIAKLIYPGLSSHPGHEVAKRQMKGFGAMISMEVTGGQARAEKIAQSLRLFAFAVSLGGVESLVQHPANMTHAILPPERRQMLGVTDNLLRLSVGIEHVDDLIADLESAMTSA
ncbi:cystathionine beta-lyase [Roseibium sp. TrichSKD4]|nr:cystathionine beta-lyase [Roseibium sp. TrichSKD4]